MLPLVVAGGLLIAISFMFSFNVIENTGVFQDLPNMLINIGSGVAFKLMIAVFAGYVAFSIADRPGLAVGLIAGMLASEAGAGILGGIIAGFLAGYVGERAKCDYSIASKPDFIKTDFNFTALGFDDCWFDDDLPHQSTSG